jgi:hypothetical protein
MDQQRHEDQYELLEAKQYPQVLEKITKLEQELNEILPGKTALVAYINKK